MSWRRRYYDVIIANTYKNDSKMSNCLHTTLLKINVLLPSMKRRHLSRHHNIIVEIICKNDGKLYDFLH